VAAAGAATEVRWQWSGTGNVLGIARNSSKFSRTWWSTHPGDARGHSVMSGCGPPTSRSPRPDSFAGAGDYVQFEVQDDGAGIPRRTSKRSSPRSSQPSSMAPASASPRCWISSASMAARSGWIPPSAPGQRSPSFCPRRATGYSRGSSRAHLRFGTVASCSWTMTKKICLLSGQMLAGLDYKYDVAKNGEEAIRFTNATSTLAGPTTGDHGPHHHWRDGR